MDAIGDEGAGKAVAPLERGEKKGGHQHSGGGKKKVTPITTLKNTERVDCAGGGEKLKESPLEKRKGLIRASEARDKKSTFYSRRKEVKNALLKHRKLKKKTRLGLKTAEARGGRSVIGRGKAGRRTRACLGGVLIRGGAEGTGKGTKEQLPGGTGTEKSPRKRLRKPDAED